MKRFEGKTVVIAGGGSGMGRVSCQKFAAEGAKVCVVDINESAAHETVKLIEAEGGIARAYGVDITKEDQMKSLFDDVVERFNSLDVYFKNDLLDSRTGILSIDTTYKDPYLGHGYVRMDVDEGTGEGTKTFLYRFEA